VKQRQALKRVLFSSQVLPFVEAQMPARTGQFFVEQSVGVSEMKLHVQDQSEGGHQQTAGFVDQDLAVWGLWSFFVVPDLDPVHAPSFGVL